MDRLHFADAEIDTKLDFAIRMEKLEEEYSYDPKESCFLGYGGISLKVFQDKWEKYKKYMEENNLPI